MLRQQPQLREDLSLEELLQPTFEFNITKSPSENASATGRQLAKAAELTNEMITATSNDLSRIDADAAADQFAPNETILQLVAQIPNHPLQKIAQKLIVDRPKSASESHSKNGSGNNTATTNESTISSTSSECAIAEPGGRRSKCSTRFSRSHFQVQTLPTSRASSSR